MNLQRNSLIFTNFVLWDYFVTGERIRANQSKMTRGKGRVVWFCLFRVPACSLRRGQIIELAAFWLQCFLRAQNSARR